MLSLDGVSAGYDGVPVVGPLDLRVDSGAVTVLLGANGAGKTTVLDAIAGLIPLLRGSLLFEDHTLGRYSAAKRARKGISYAMEGHRVFPAMSVEDNLLLAAKGQGRATQAAWDECYTLFPILADRKSQAAGLLSGGEQQMLALGRALMGDPKVLILDEPSLGLAPRVVQTVYESIARLSESGRTILLSEQNVAHAMSLASSVYVLDRGRVVLDGTPQQLRDDERLTSAYLG